MLQWNSLLAILLMKILSSSGGEIACSNRTVIQQAGLEGGREALLGGEVEPALGRSPADRVSEPHRFPPSAEARSQRLARNSSENSFNCFSLLDQAHSERLSLKPGRTYHRELGLLNKYFKPRENLEALYTNAPIYPSFSYELVPCNFKNQWDWFNTAPATEISLLGPSELYYKSILKSRFSPNKTKKSYDNHLREAHMVSSLFSDVKKNVYFESLGKASGNSVQNASLEIKGETNLAPEKINSGIGSCTADVTSISSLKGNPEHITDSLAILHESRGLLSKKPQLVEVHDRIDCSTGLKEHGQPNMRKRRFQGANNISPGEKLDDTKAVLKSIEQEAVSDEKRFHKRSPKNRYNLKYTLGRKNMYNSLDPSPQSDSGGELDSFFKQRYQFTSHLLDDMRYKNSITLNPSSLPVLSIGKGTYPRNILDRLISGKNQFGSDRCSEIMKLMTGRLRNATTNEDIELPAQVSEHRPESPLQISKSRGAKPAAMNPSFWSVDKSWPKTGGEKSTGSWRSENKKIFNIYSKYKGNKVRGSRSADGVNNVHEDGTHSRGRRRTAGDD